MPLEPTTEFRDRAGDIVFEMLDGTTQVVCRVTREALDDLAGANASTGPDRAACFLKHRALIMAIASRKYDDGEVVPVITSSDLTV